MLCQTKTTYTVACVETRTPKKIIPLPWTLSDKGIHSSRSGVKLQKSIMRTPRRRRVSECVRGGDQHR